MFSWPCAEGSQVIFFPICAHEGQKERASFFFHKVNPFLIQLYLLLVYHH